MLDYAVLFRHDRDDGLQELPRDQEAETAAYAAA
jgi:hypothetical protein